MLSSNIRGVKPGLVSPLATEAREILSDLKILEELSKYGEAKVVGSVSKTVTSSDNSVRL